MRNKKGDKNSIKRRKREREKERERERERFIVIYIPSFINIA